MRPIGVNDGLPELNAYNRLRIRDHKFNRDCRVASARRLPSMLRALPSVLGARAVTTLADHARIGFHPAACSRIRAGLVSLERYELFTKAQKG